MWQIIGTIPKPDALKNVSDVSSGGIGEILNFIFQLLIIIGGIYAVINFILAGYAFMSAGDDPKKAAGAWAKIWQSILGLIFMTGAFVIAAIVGKLIFGDAAFILSPKIPTF